MLNSISAIDSTNVWAVGGGNLLFFDGFSWVDRSSESPGRFYCVFALDLEHVWFTGEGKVYFFNGTSWTEQFEATEHFHFFSLFFLDSNNGWIVGSAMWEEEGKSRDVWNVYSFDGSAWQLEYESPVMKNLLFAEHMVSVTASDTDNVWLGGSCGIYHGSKTQVGR